MPKVYSSSCTLGSCISESTHARTMSCGCIQMTTLEDGVLRVPDQPVIPFIEGDGIGPDIWSAAQHVFDGAVRHAYGDDRAIVWFEVLAGEKANNTAGSWLPDDTLTAIDHHLVAIKGPLTTPVGGGFRSLNVTWTMHVPGHRSISRPVFCISQRPRF